MSGRTRNVVASFALAAMVLGCSGGWAKQREEKEPEVARGTGGTSGEASVASPVSAPATDPRATAAWAVQLVTDEKILQMAPEKAPTRFTPMFELQPGPKSEDELVLEAGKPLDSKSWAHISFWPRAAGGWRFQSVNLNFMPAAEEVSALHEQLLNGLS